MPALNPLVTVVEPPPIPEAHGWAARYSGAMGPPIDLCQAVPGYPPHPAILEHLAAEAADPARARYGLIEGDAALRDAYAASVSATYAGSVAPDQVAITAGCMFISGLLIWYRGPLDLFALITLLPALVYLADVRPAVREVSGGSGSRW